MNKVAYKKQRFIPLSARAQDIEAKVLEYLVCGGGVGVGFLTPRSCSSLDLECKKDNMVFWAKPFCGPGN